MAPGVGEAAARGGKQRSLKGGHIRYWALSGLILVATLAAGCADKTIALSYAPPPPARDVTGPRLLVVRFADQRGGEGDEGDPYRIGGVYGGYGNRLAKVMVDRPWPTQLLAALVAEFRAQGINADGTEASIPTGEVPRLEGDVRNFSTESRWGREAHISAIVRLRAAAGNVLVEKRIAVRESGYTLNNFDAGILEELMNRAFARFVRTVATDLEIRGHLARLPGTARGGAAAARFALTTISIEIE